jgi:hypothetical protein
MLLEDFHQHFVRIHMKDKAACVLEELNQQAAQSGQSLASQLVEWMIRHYPQAAFRDDKWYAREIPLDKCYFAHEDFRGRLVPKDQRFVEFLRDNWSEIQSGLFPCSSEILAPWAGQMPEPLIQERGPEKYYVLDGQLRVIRHWYHNVPKVRVFIYRGKLAV